MRQVLGYTLTLSPAWLSGLFLWFVAGPKTLLVVLGVVITLMAIVLLGIGLLSEKVE